MSAVAERKPLSMPSRSGSSRLVVHPSLKIGRSGDKYEQEAESVANHVVMSPPNAAPALAMSPAPNSDPTFQMQAEEEEETLQMMPFAESSSILQLSSMEEEEESIQLSPDFTKTIQRQEKEEEAIQLSPDGAPTASPEISSQITQSKGSGQSLPGPVQAEMGQKIGADFSGVSIHTGSEAAGMSNALGAQAFTHGNDVYFNEGKYQPETSNGKYLLAHELTHTVQQGGAPVRRMPMLQLEEDVVEEVSPPATEFGLPNGTTIETASTPGEFILPMISFPTFKGRNQDRFPLNMELRRGGRPTTNQIRNWKNELRPSVTEALDEKLAESRAAYGYGTESNVVFFFKPTNSKPLRVFGNRESLIETFLIPFWDRNADPSTFQVDHINEDQLGGDDDIYNYELLESGANGSAGPTIAGEIRRRLKESIDGVKADPNQSADFNTRFAYGTSVTELTRLKNDYSITFTEREFTKPVTGRPDVYWGALEMVENQQMEILSILSPAELQQEGLAGSNPDILLIFPGPNGGSSMRLQWGADQPVGQYVDLSGQNLKLFDNTRISLLGAQYNPAGALENGNVGFVRIQPFGQDNTTLLEVEGESIFDWQIDAISGLEYGGSINRESVAGSVRRSLRFPGLSPIELTNIELDPNVGIIGSGKLLPTVPFIQDADIDIIIEGDSIRFRKLFLLEEMDLPRPFDISDSSLEVFVGTEGLGIEGLVNFGIQGVGEGHIGAAASTAGGFELEGAFNFDSELFDPAEIRVEYKNEIWTLGGTIGIPEGKIRGVKNASINATYSENVFSAEGVAELDIPGIEEGRMSIEYGENGFSIGGSFNLSNEVPGISGGSVEARVSKENGEEAYHVFVSGTAQPDIPGINSSLTVTYEDGALTIEGSASYSRGMLSGRINVTATNRSIGEEGQPTGDPTDEILVFGGGSLTLQITPWLAATAEVQFLPNGELEVTARLSSDEYEVFSRREINRNLFRVPTIEIPIFAIPLGPRSIGLVAQIGGGLDFTAGFGPGALQNMSAEIIYNPAHEEETTLNGHGEFVIPADAGLTLRGDLSLGVSAGIASLTGGIELEGSLGLDGQALASVDVNWSPQTGLTIDASGRITVNPKFVFGINAFARASLGIGWFSISETWRHNLASYEWGPDIQFGIVFPIHYQEGEPFALSFEDLEVIYPDLDVVNMAVGLARDIKDEIF